MGVFQRSLTEQTRKAIRKMTESSDGNWWRDLLSVWSPSGTPVNTTGLRMALRKNYLNFYRHGQSIAKVSANRNGQLIARVHIAFAFGQDAEQQKYTNQYACLCGNTVTHAESEGRVRYEGVETLSQWVGRAECHQHKREEKVFVDQVVADNPSVIDVEVGLPAWTTPKRASMMDVAALDSNGKSPRIVFWEAKLINNDELVSNTVSKVIAQIDKYKDFLSDDGRRDSMESAYRQTIEVFKMLHSMAGAAGIHLPALDPGVLAAAEPDTKLEIDVIPRLIIDVTKGPRRNWDKHNQKLLERGIVPLMCNVRPYCLFAL